MTTFNKYLDNPTVRITLFVGGIDEKARRLMFLPTRAVVVLTVVVVLFPCGPYEPWQGAVSSIGRRRRHRRKSLRSRQAGLSLSQAVPSGTLTV